MNAKKCDLCGKFFMPYLEDFKGDVNSYARVDVNQIDMDGFDEPGNMYELCEDCSASLNKWLESRGVDNAETR